MRIYEYMRTLRISSLLFIFSSSFAQFPCGTSFPEEKIAELQKFYSGAVIQKSLADDTFFIPLKIHIIRNADGTGGLNEQKFYKELDTVNYFFKNAGMVFFTCGKINNVNESQFRTFNTPEEEDALVKPTEIAHVINVYFTDTLLLNGTRVCGYSYLPMGRNAIFIDNACANNGNTLAHELGHFFSLLHTHGISNTTLTDELVNGSNCTNAGDYICDTPADPNLSGKVFYNPLTKKCAYTGNLKDANGELYKPMAENIMSYSKPQCTDSFTIGQYAMMRNSLFYHGRIDLFCTSEDVIVNESNLLSVEPNPFHDYFFVYYQLTADAHVTLALYNILGEKVFDVYDNVESNGLLKLYFPLGNTWLHSGIYFLKMEVNEMPVSVKKMVRINP